MTCLLGFLHIHFSTLDINTTVSTCIPKYHKAPDSYINITVAFGNGDGMIPLDNIGAFDRNMQFKNGEYLEQADGTSWMAMFALNMMRISMELALYNPVYEDMAIKFFEHYWEYWNFTMIFF